MDAEREPTEPPLGREIDPVRAEDQAYAGKTESDLASELRHEFRSAPGLGDVPEAVERLDNQTGGLESLATVYFEAERSRQKLRDVLERDGSLAGEIRRLEQEQEKLRERVLSVRTDDPGWQEHSVPPILVQNLNLWESLTLARQMQGALDMAKGYREAGDLPGFTRAAEQLVDRLRKEYGTVLEASTHSGALPGTDDNVMRLRQKLEGFEDILWALRWEAEHGGAER